MDALISQATIGWLKRHRRHTTIVDLLADVEPSRAWSQWNLPERRYAIKLAFEAIVVLPQGQTGKTFQPELITMRPRLPA